MFFFSKLNVSKLGKFFVRNSRVNNYYAWLYEDVANVK